VKLGAYNFINLGEPEFELDAVGQPASFRPQDRFENPTGLKKHKYGDLEYCKFRIAGLPRAPGCYAFVQNDHVLYIGKASMIAQRFMPGYRLVSPRMCYAGGPQTTCRINALLLKETLENKAPSILVYQTALFHDVEAELLSYYSPIWNRTVA